MNKKRRSLIAVIVLLSVVISTQAVVQAQTSTQTSTQTQTQSQTQDQTQTPTQAAAQEQSSTQAAAQEQPSTQAAAQKQPSTQAAAQAQLTTQDTAKTASNTAAVSAKQDKSQTLIKLADVNYYEGKYLKYLEGQLSDTVAMQLRYGEDIPSCYTQIKKEKASEKFPEKFDLRDYDIITPVKAQRPWGTCWAFGTVAAAESSILTALGLTQTQYAEKYGEPLDLSEKHLAWFTATALPEVADYPEGQYPYDITQAGEGSHSVDDSKALDFGGNYFLSTSVMASGIGPIKEKIVPYADSKGELNKDGDWSVDEEKRFRASFTLANANVLPAPALVDSDGQYTYNEAATNAIKSEILSGHAVGISYKSDRSKPKEIIYKTIRDEAVDTGLASEEEADFYAKVRSGMAEATEEQLKSLIVFRLRINKYDENKYDLTGLTKEQLFKVLNSGSYSESLETILSMEETKTYMSFPVDENGKTIWAQYTNEPIQCTHAVCAVGWDDTFPASSFPEDRRPPADGAWIVKNSWGTSWGMDGYFYLSYFDQSLYACQSFEFVPMNTDTIEVLEKDFMPAECIDSTLMDIPVLTSTVFTTESDGVPQYLSVLTGDFDTEYTLSLYLLSDDAVTPTDGILLDTVTDSAHLGGYHRVKLSNHVKVPKGSRLGVTVIERVTTDNGTKFALVNTSSLGEKYVEYKNSKEPDRQHRYCKGIINSGESFISFGNDRWIDWKEVTDSFYAKGGNFDYIQYDNIPLKVFSYTITDVEEMHDFNLQSKVPGGTAEICSDCGYALTTLDE